MESFGLESSVRKDSRLSQLFFWYENLLLHQNFREYGLRLIKEIPRTDMEIDKKYGYEH